MKNEGSEENEITKRLRCETREKAGVKIRKKKNKRVKRAREIKGKENEVGNRG